MRVLGRLLRRYSMEDISDAKAQRDTALLARAVRSRDTSIRLAGIDALGQISPHEATPVLVSVLYDDEPNVRSAAARVLRNHRWNPKNDAEKIAGLIASSDFATLSNLSADELLENVPTVGPVWSRSRPFTWSLAVLTALKYGPAATGDRLLEMLVSSDRYPLKRAMAAQALAVRKDDRAVEPLLALYLYSPGQRFDSEECRDSMATALQLFSQQDAMAQRIMDVMLTALHGGHASFACNILGYIGARAAGPLRRLTEDRSAGGMVRGLAACGLAGTGAPGSLDTLCHSGGDLLFQMAFSAILRKTKDKPLPDTYIEIYHQRLDVTDRMMAVQALGNLRHPNVSFLEWVAKCDGQHLVRREAVFALGKMTHNPDTRRALLNAVNDASWPSGERLTSLLVLLWHDIPLLDLRFNLSDASS